MPLESGVRFYETGLYAHAASSYVFDLDGKWKQFTSAYGLENLCQGSVVFIVNCDGEERFRSDLVEDWTEGHVDIDVSGVKRLELVITEGALRGIAEQAMGRGTGARGLRAIMEEVLLDTMYELLPPMLAKYRIPGGTVASVILEEASRRCGITPWTVQRHSRHGSRGRNSIRMAR